MTIAIDKIPIKAFNEDPITQRYTLGTLELTKGEYANAEKINEIIDELRKQQEQLFKLEAR